MKAFAGSFTFKVDKKGRVSVPAEFRVVLAAQAAGSDFTGFLAFPWFEYRAVRGCGVELMERIAQNRSPTAVFENQPVDNALVSVADMMQLPFDSEGRIVLPRDLAEHAGITESATFVGQVNFFEVWNPAAFTQHPAARRALRSPATGN